MTAASTALRDGNGTTKKLEPQLTSWAGARGVERFDTDRRRQRLRILDGLAEGRLELRHPGEGQLPVLPFEIEVGRADAEAEGGVREPGLEHTGVREGECRADRRMAGKRRFRRAREDADAMIGAGGLGRKNERALGQVRLPCQRLHRVGVEPCRLGEDEELIPVRPAIGEHIEMDVAVGRRAALLEDPGRRRAEHREARKPRTTELAPGHLRHVRCLRQNSHENAKTRKHEKEVFSFVLSCFRGQSR
jgi:hypothetical protein